MTYYIPIENSYIDIELKVCPQLREEHTIFIIWTLFNGFMMWGLEKLTHVAFNLFFVVFLSILRNSFNGYFKGFNPSCHALPYTTRRHSFLIYIYAINGLILTVEDRKFMEYLFFIAVTSILHFSVKMLHLSKFLKPF